MRKKFYKIACHVSVVCIASYTISCGTLLRYHHTCAYMELLKDTRSSAITNYKKVFEKPKMSTKENISKLYVNQDNTAIINEVL